MKTIILFSLILFSGCSSQKDKRLSGLKSSLDEYYKDYFFKENIDYEIMKFEAISFDTATQNEVDSVMIDKWLTVCEKHTHEGTMLTKEIEINNLRIGLFSDAVLINQLKMANEEKKVKRLECYNNSQACLGEIKKLQYKIDKNKTPEKVLRVKIFLKAVLIERKGKEKMNISDTFYHYFDFDNKKIDEITVALKN